MHSATVTYRLDETLETEVLGSKRINLLQSTLSKLRERYEIDLNAELIEAYNG